MEELEQLSIGKQENIHSRDMGKKIEELYLLGDVLEGVIEQMRGELGNMNSDGIEGIVLGDGLQELQELEVDMCVMRQYMILRDCFINLFILCETKIELFGVHQKNESSFPFTERVRSSFSKIKSLFIF
jgi:hypothetical protein